MTPTTLLASMVAAGAVITRADGFLRSMPYVAEILQDGPRRGLWWIEAGTFDQSGSHVLTFERLELQNDERDLYLYAGTGEAIAWVTPALDTPEVSTDEVREALAAYRQELAAPGAMEDFQQFAAAMRADALESVRLA